jgi:phosphatidate cytidylyltransferase
MLRQRLVTALVIAIIGLSALFLLPAPAFALFGAVLLAGLGGWEGSRLAGLDATGWRYGLGALLVAACLAIYFFAPDGLLMWLLVTTAAVWILNFSWLARPQLGRRPSRGTITVKLLVISIILVSASLALAWLQAISPWLVVLLLVLIASADTFAYFTGRHFGGPKLAPRISPGKTRSGAVGGLAGAMLLTAVATLVLPDMPFGPALAAGLALLIALASIGGDLFISLLKRHRELKDTSELLPGHGGVLDRFDSLSAALPLFTLAVMLWGY